MKPTPERLNELWQSPSSWRGGLFYYCSEDPRVIVPKRQKWRGWTVNFARPSAIPVLVGSMALVVAPMIGLAIEGYTLTWIWWALMAAVVALLSVICWYFSSAERYRS